MWTEVYQCRVCKIRYSLEPTCALCQEKAFWKDTEPFPWEVILAAEVFVVIAIGIGLLLR